MYAQETNRSPAWVLVVLLILGILIFNMFNPPVQTQGISATPTGTVLIPLTGNPTSAQDQPTPSPTINWSEQTRAAIESENGVLSAYATQEAITLEQAENRRKATSQAWAETSAVNSTQARIHQAEANTASTQATIRQWEANTASTQVVNTLMSANAASTQTANKQTQAIANSTQTANELNRQIAKDRAEQERMVRTVTAILSMGVACGLLVIGVGLAIRWNLDVQHQNGSAAEIRPE